MKVVYLNRDAYTASPCVATIGFFDGVHLGHHHLIQQVKSVARESGLSSMLVTFIRHPRQVLQTDWHPQLLSSFDDKVALLSATGVDKLVVLSFDAQMAALSARDFMHDVLQRQLGVRVLLTGYDNHFGHRGAGSTEGFADYVAYGRQLGIRVVLGTPFSVGDIRVSSSKIRHFLSSGDVEQAARCLGRPYTLSGRVVSGEHIGTGLGYPTANMQLSDASRLIPASGAYAVQVSVDGQGPMLNGMMNIGSRPTFHGDRQTLETHIFHFDGNLYGRSLSVSFVSRLRPELTFDSAEALAAQLAADARRSEEILRHPLEL